MFQSRFLSMSLLATMIAVPAFAQTASPVGGIVGTDVTQQQEIENGLKTGTLSTGEAARLEKGEQKIDRTESKALRDGTLSTDDAARIQTLQTKEDNKINKLETNKTVGDPNAASSKRMQADVQRNVNQEKRIQNGVNSGALTNRETARLEKGQAHVTGKEAHAGKNGKITAAEQRRIKRTENRQGKKIFHKKHNARTATETGTGVSQ